MKKIIILMIAVVAVTFTTSCSGGRKVTRVSADSTIDLSGGWNDADARMTAEAMVKSSLQGAWIDKFRAANKGKQPVVKVGRIIVRANGDVIDTEIITDCIIEAFVNSGEVDVVASNSENHQARAEQADQDVRASDESKKEAFQELGADFLMLGTIKTQDDKGGRSTVKFYQMSLKMTDVKTQRQVWIKTNPIKKVVKRGKFR